MRWSKGKRVKHRITIDREAVADFCRRNGIRRLALFGSILRDTFQEGSDVDVLVDFHPETRAGFLRMAAMESELSQLLRRQVDLRTPAELSRYFRDEVLREAEVQYEQG